MIANSEAVNTVGALAVFALVLYLLIASHTSTDKPAYAGLYHRRRMKVRRVRRWQPWQAFKRYAVAAWHDYWIED